MKGWQALCWGGWQDSPSGLTPGKETFGENPPGQHLGLMAFKWGEYLIFTLARGDGGWGGGESLSSHSQVWGCLLSHPAAPADASVRR